MNSLSEISFEFLPEAYTIYRFDSSVPIPVELPASGLLSISRSDDELSIVAPTGTVEAHVPTRPLSVEAGFRCFRIPGTLDFSLLGIIASVTGQLAQAEVPVFVVSTFDTDYFLVRSEFESEVRSLLFP